MVNARRIAVAAMWLLACETTTLNADSDAGAPDAGSSPDASMSAGALPAIIGSASRVLFVGAHPDDEQYAAPLLFELCVRRGLACFFLVVTDGGKGSCVLGTNVCGVSDTGGMPPGSVGAFRLEELKLSVAYFNGTLSALGLEDTASATVQGDAENWNQTYSGIPNDTGIDLITQKFVEAIQQSSADVIITFDPRHGVYCQPDHRAVGALTLRAALLVGFELSRIVMIESAELYIDWSGQVAQRAWVPDDAALWHYDADDAGTWPARPAVLGYHKSQYPDATVQAVANVPTNARMLAFLPASEAIDGGRFIPSPQYDAICATQAWWDGHGVCPRADGGTGPCW